jgi:hypothetical protein
VTEYKVARAASAYDLEADVREMLGRGWAPLGGVAVAMGYSSGDREYAQAMTRSRTAPTPNEKELLRG